MPLGAISLCAQRPPFSWRDSCIHKHDLLACYLNQIVNYSYNRLLAQFWLKNLLRGRLIKKPYTCLLGLSYNEFYIILRLVITNYSCIWCGVKAFLLLLVFFLLKNSKNASKFREKKLDCLPIQQRK
jgi:hypothetical protein